MCKCFLYVKIKRQLNIKFSSLNIFLDLIPIILYLYHELYYNIIVELLLYKLVTSKWQTVYIIKVYAYNATVYVRGSNSNKWIHLVTRIY